MKRITVFCIPFLIFFISSSVAVHAASDQLSGTKTVTTLGIAYIGSEITLEEAKVVALANAQSVALIQLGVFVEASRTVQDFKFSQNEIRSITGAIMKSIVVKEEKKIENDNFILSLTVTSEISMDSLRNALEIYQDRSKDRKLIKQLMATVMAMRDRLSEKQISDLKWLLENIDKIDWDENGKLAIDGWMGVLTAYYEKNQLISEIEEAIETGEKEAGMQQERLGLVISYCKNL